MKGREPFSGLNSDRCTLTQIADNAPVQSEFLHSAPWCAMHCFRHRLYGSEQIVTEHKPTTTEVTAEGASGELRTVSRAVSGSTFYLVL